MPQDQPHTAAPEESTGSDAETESHKLRDFGLAAALLGQKGLISVIRLVLPLIEEFARSGKADEQVTKDQTSLSPPERDILKAAMAKIAYEMIAYASAQHPVEGVDRYVARPDKDSGQYPPISTAHLYSLATLIRESLSSGRPTAAEPSGRGLRGSGTTEDELPVEPILLMSVGANEYRLIDRPRTPLEIRRAAGRQRELSLRARR